MSSPSDGPTVRLSEHRSKPVARPQEMQHAHPTSTSLPQAGHFKSPPPGGWPQWGQNFTLRLPGRTPPQYSHWFPDGLSPFTTEGTGERGMGFSPVQLGVSSSSSQ